MAKLYFKYGVMGSSKTAQALITKFNYEERGMKVWLINPRVDNRYKKGIVKSRAGLSATAYIVSEDEDIYRSFASMKEHYDVVIVDESQFFWKYRSIS
jgi:thymidine kinase